MRHKIVIGSLFAILILGGGIIVRGTSVSYSGGAQTASVVLASSTLPAQLPTTRSVAEVKKELAQVKRDMENARVALQTLLPKFSSDTNAAFQSVIPNLLGAAGADKGRAVLFTTSDRSLSALVSADSARTEVGLTEWKHETDHMGESPDAAKVLVVAGNGVTYIANLENFFSALTKALHAADTLKTATKESGLNRVVKAQEIADTTQTKLLTLIKDLNDASERVHSLTTELNRALAAVN